MRSCLSNGVVRAALMTIFCAATLTASSSLASPVELAAVKLHAANVNTTTAMCGLSAVSNSGGYKCINVAPCMGNNICDACPPGYTKSASLYLQNNRWLPITCTSNDANAMSNLCGLGISSDHGCVSMAPCRGVQICETGCPAPTKESYKYRWSEFIPFSCYYEDTVRTVETSGNLCGLAVTRGYDGCVGLVDCFGENICWDKCPDKRNLTNGGSLHWDSFNPRTCHFGMIKEVLFDNVVYDLPHATKVTKPISVDRCVYINNLDEPAPQRCIKTVSIQTSTQFIQTTGLKITESVKFTIEVPEVSKNEIGLSEEYSWTESMGVTKAMTQSFAVDSAVPVPAHNKRYATITAQQNTIKVSYTATVTVVWTDGHRTQEQIAGEFNGVSVSELTVQLDKGVSALATNIKKL